MIAGLEYVSEHGIIYDFAAGSLALIIGAELLRDAYRGLWRPGGIGSSQAPLKARWFERIWLSLGGIFSAYLGYYLISLALAPRLPTPPIPGKEDRAAVNVASGVFSALLAITALYGAYKVNRTGKFGFRGRLVRAAWYHRLFFFVLSLGFAWASWAFFRR
jgi:hypothetical protein